MIAELKATAEPHYIRITHLPCGAYREELRGPVEAALSEDAQFIMHMCSSSTLMTLNDIIEEADRYFVEYPEELETYSPQRIQDALDELVLATFVAVSGHWPKPSDDYPPEPVPHPRPKP